MPNWFTLMGFFIRKAWHDLYRYVLCVAGVEAVEGVYQYLYLISQITLKDGLFSI